MSFFQKLFGKKGSAQMAKNRLKVQLAHERSLNLPYINEMRQEIIDVIKKYTGANADSISFKTDSNQNINMLEIEINLN